MVKTVTTTGIQNKIPATNCFLIILTLQTFSLIYTLLLRNAPHLTYNIKHFTSPIHFATFTVCLLIKTSNKLSPNPLPNIFSKQGPQAVCSMILIKPLKKSSSKPRSIFIKITFQAPQKHSALVEHLCIKK